MEGVCCEGWRVFRDGGWGCLFVVDMLLRGVVLESVMFGRWYHRLQLICV